MNENEQKAMDIRSLNEMAATGIPVSGRSSHKHVFLTFARPDVSELHITNSLSCEAKRVTGHDQGHHRSADLSGG